MKWVACLVAAFAMSVGGGEAAATARGPLGLGFQLGEPSGISAKLWTGKSTAVDGVIAWSFVGAGALHLQGDFLAHDFDVFPVSDGSLPIYYGIGGRVRLEDPESRAGVRLPVGVAYMFENTPLDIYFEVAPIVEVVPETDFSLNGGVGVRYYFR